MSDGDWGRGWDCAVERARYLLTQEISMAESRLSLNKEDFPSNHPAVILVEEQIRSLKRVLENLNV